MDKKMFCKKIMFWTAIVVAAVMLILGLCFGKVIEANIWEEIGKWIAVTAGLIAIFEVFAFVLSPIIFHSINDKKDGPGVGMD